LHGQIIQEKLLDIDVGGATITDPSGGGGGTDIVIGPGPDPGDPNGTKDPSTNTPRPISKNKIKYTRI